MNEMKEKVDRILKNQLVFMLINDNEKYDKEFNSAFAETRKLLYRKESTEEPCCEMPEEESE